MDIKQPQQTDKGSHVSSVYLLGDVIFHADIGELTLDSSGLHIHLEKKVSQVLACLAKTPNDVVTREAIFDCVWPNITVSDDSLNRCIAILRKTFKTHALPLSIKTHPKVGFHLHIAESSTLSNRENNQISKDNVFTNGSGALATKQANAQVKVKDNIHPFNTLLFSLLILALLMLIAGFWLSIQQSQLASFSAKRLVVLPFNIDMTTSSRYITLANTIREKIANNTPLTTIADSDLSQYHQQSSKAVGEQFNARFIIQGNITARGNRDILSWQLVDASSSDIILSQQLNLKLHNQATNSQIIVTDIIAAIGRTLFADSPGQQVSYIVEAAKQLFIPSDNWQQQRPIITLVAQTIAEVDPESVIALKALSEFLTETMWPLGYQNLPYSSLAIRVLEKAVALSPDDVELYQLLMRIYVMQYNWHAANDMVTMAVNNAKISTEQQEQLQAELKLLTGQIEPSLITFFQHKHQNSPLESRFLLALFQLYLLAENEQAAFNVKSLLIQTSNNWRLHGVALGQVSINNNEIAQGKDLIWDAFHYLGVPNSYQQDIYSLYLTQPLNATALVRLESAYENNDILPTAMLFIYGSNGLIEEYYDLALSLIDTYQFNLTSIVNIHSQRLIHAPQFPALLKKMGLIDYWQEVGLPSYCVKADENICTAR